MVLRLPEQDRDPHRVVRRHDLALLEVALEGARDGVALPGEVLVGLPNEGAKARLVLVEELRAAGGLVVAGPFREHSLECGRVRPTVAFGPVGFSERRRVRKEGNDLIDPRSEAGWQEALDGRCGPGLALRLLRGQARRNLPSEVREGSATAPGRR